MAYNEPSIYQTSFDALAEFITTGIDCILNTVSFFKSLAFVSSTAFGDS